jgi:hypothetical protein
MISGPFPSPSRLGYQVNPHERSFCGDDPPGFHGRSAAADSARCDGFARAARGMDVDEVSGGGHEHAHRSLSRADGFRTLDLDLHDEVGAIPSGALEDLADGPFDDEDRIVPGRSATILGGRQSTHIVAQDADHQDGRPSRNRGVHRILRGG